MKKFLGVLLVAVFMVLPMSAVAGIITTADMTITGSNPIVNVGGGASWYGDYDTNNNPLGGTLEVFCVENADLIPTETYDFMEIINGEMDGKYDALVKSTWFANEFVTGDATKVDAQIAIWYAMGVGTNFGGSSNAESLYDSWNSGLADANSYVSDWALAVSPDGQGLNWGDQGQNFLVQNPVPVPSALFLLASGLLGLAGASRKKIA